MPDRLIKDPCPPRKPSEPVESNLYLNPMTGDYYAKAYVRQLGKERVKCLDEANRYKAILAKNLVVAQWRGTETKGKRGDIPFSAVCFEVLELMKPMAEKTFLEMEGMLRLHILQTEDEHGEPVTGSYASLLLEEALHQWPQYKALQRALTPRRKLFHDRKVLRRIFAHAYEKEWIHRIPRLHLDPRDKAVVHAQEFTDDELNALMRDANPKLRLKLETKLMTGIRDNELRLLQWAWIDWKTGEVHIPPEVAKTRQGRILVFDSVLLAKYRERYEKAVPIYVYPNRDDNSRPESATDKPWQRLKKKLGIRKKRHWFRGTAASRAVRGGVPQTVALKGMGMTAKVFESNYQGTTTDDLRGIAKSNRRAFDAGAEEGSKPDEA